MKNFANEDGLSMTITKYRGSLKTLINHKMKVLREFCVVDDDNEKEIKKYLQDYLELTMMTCPNRDPQVILDQAARPLIQQKFRED